MLRDRYEVLFKAYLYPMYNKIIGRDGYGVFKERRQSQYLNRAELDNIQLEKLKIILDNAFNYVPYYREEFRRIGFIPNDLSTLSDFSSIDFFIDKSVVRDNTEAFIADNCKPSSLNWHRTGGSTGTPLHFPTDRATDSASAAAIMKALDWWNVEVGSRHAMFWGSPTFINRKRSDIIKQWGNIIRNNLMNRKFFLNYNISEQNVEKIYNSLEYFKPIYIRGMPTSLAIFAKLLRKKGLRLSRGQPLFIHSACEQLYDWQKDVIEEGFGAPVLNTYGLSEVGDIAYEAPCGSLHIMDEDVLVELFPFANTEDHEIVTTQLNNMSSPLIRYRTGDLADEISSCSCSINLNVLCGLKGRAHDFLLAPDGRFLHGQFLTHIIVFEPGIEKYQVVQRSPVYLNISLVINSEYQPSSLDRMRSAIRSYMGSGVEIDFSIVNDIPLTAAGKHRWIVNELGSLDNYI